MTDPAPPAYADPGGSWTSAWVVSGAVVVGFLIDWALPGADLHPLVWLVALLLAGGTAWLGCRGARRTWRLTVTPSAIRVGSDELPLSDVDVEALPSVDQDLGSGRAIGERVLGAEYALPKRLGAARLPLLGGGSILVPARDPAALLRAVTSMV